MTLFDRSTLATALAAVLLPGFATASLDSVPFVLTTDQPVYQPGEPFVLTVTGAPGTLGVLLMDTDPGPTDYPGIGVLGVGFSPAFLTLPLPPMPASGFLELTCDVDCGSPLIGMPLYTQAVSIDIPAGEFCISNVAPIIYEDPFGLCDPCAAAIGDFVWHDLDANGIQDPGEPGLEGLTLVLCDAAGDEVATTQSGTDGGYLFTEVCPGSYTVKIAPQSIPPGLAPVLCGQGGDAAVDSNCAPATTVIVVNGDEDRSLDFGFANCDECKGGVTALSLVNTGAASVAVEINDDGLGTQTFFSGTVAPGGDLTIFGTESDGKFPDNNIELFVDGVKVADIHVSCSQPVGPGTEFGEFVVSGAVSKDNGPVCVEPNDDCDSGDPAQLTMRYVGGDCSVIYSGQDEDKANCSGDSLSTDPVRIVSRNSGFEIYSDDIVTLGGTFVIDATAIGDSALKSATFVDIYALDGTLLQEIEFHTSCSQPLGEGDQFGSIVLELFIPKP